MTHIVIDVSDAAEAVEACALARDLCHGQGDGGGSQRERVHRAERAALRGGRAREVAAGEGEECQDATLSALTQSPSLQRLSGLRCNSLMKLGEIGPDGR